MPSASTPAQAMLPHCTPWAPRTLAFDPTQSCRVFFCSPPLCDSIVLSPLRSRPCRRGKSTAGEVRRPRFQLYHLLALLPWASPFTSQNYSFLIHKMGPNIPALSVPKRCVGSFIQTTTEPGPVRNTGTADSEDPILILSEIKSPL